jgi:hypothetical protein
MEKMLKEFAHFLGYQILGGYKLLGRCRLKKHSQNSDPPIGSIKYFQELQMMLKLPKVSAESPRFIKMTGSFHLL